MSTEYEEGFTAGYEKGGKDAYQEALVKGFERGVTVMKATGVGFAKGVYKGPCNPFFGRRAQLILLGNGLLKAKFIMGETWETQSSLLFKVEEWKIDQDSILGGPNG